MCFLSADLAGPPASVSECRRGQAVARAADADSDYKEVRELADTTPLGVLEEPRPVTAEVYVPLYYAPGEAYQGRFRYGQNQEGKLIERTQVLELTGTLKLCGIPGSIVASKSIDRTQAGEMIDGCPRHVSHDVDGASSRRACDLARLPHHNTKLHNLAILL